MKLNVVHLWIVISMQVHARKLNKWIMHMRSAKRILSFKCLCSLIRLWKKGSNLTSLLRAEEAVPLFEGSIASKISMRAKADDDKSLKVSAMQRLYWRRGLKTVACWSFDLFQYSSDGEPQSLNILCSCSTYINSFNEPIQQN